MAVVIDTEGRHPSVSEVAQWFSGSHLPAHLAAVSDQFTTVAAGLLDELPDSPELTVALRKLLESKDAAVRCAVAANRDLTVATDLRNKDTYEGKPPLKD